MLPVGSSIASATLDGRRVRVDQVATARGLEARAYAGGGRGTSVLVVTLR